MIWQAYRLFIIPSDPEQVGAVEDYIALLQQVVQPLVTEYAAAVSRYHFQQLVGPYRFFPEDGGVHTPVGAAPDEVVHFVRLCVEVQDDQADSLFDRLAALCQEAPSCAGGEIPLQAYDPQGDLGRRFGPGRVEAVLEVLHGASRLALSFAAGSEPYDPTQNGQGGAAGLMHLLGSTLRYVVPGYLFENGMYHRMPLPCVVLDWQRELRYTSYPLP